MMNRGERVGRWLDVWLPLIGIVFAGIGAWRIGGFNLTAIVVGSLVVFDQRV